jgi:hypothetical protein
MQLVHDMVKITAHLNNVHIYHYLVNKYPEYTRGLETIAIYSNHNSINLILSDYSDPKKILLDNNFHLLLIRRNMISLLNNFFTDTDYLDHYQELLVNSIIPGNFESVEYLINLDYPITNLCKIHRLAQETMDLNIIKLIFAKDSNMVIKNNFFMKSADDKYSSLFIWYLDNINISNKNK